MPDLDATSGKLFQSDAGLGVLGSRLPQLVTEHLITRGIDELV
jgi:hypothetical protein